MSTLDNSEIRREAWNKILPAVKGYIATCIMNADGNDDFHSLDIKLGDIDFSACDISFYYRTPQLVQDNQNTIYYEGIVSFDERSDHGFNHLYDTESYKLEKKYLTHE